jgi:5-amino-6-(5-phospho-D-ribitylamino)uracil phosphatase
MIAIDLDGTLLRDDKTMAPDAATELRRLSAGGIYVVIASARPPRSVRPFHDALGLVTPIVAYNGALVWGFSPPRALEHSPLPGSLVRALTLAARDVYPDCLLNIEASDIWITDRVDHRYQTQTAKLFPPDRVAPMELWHGEPATKLLVQGDPARLAHVRLHLSARFTGQAHIVSTEPDCLQIMRAGIDKAAGVKLIASGLHIGSQEVLAIGDNDNDVEMLEAFGFSAAMATGTNAAKRSAKRLVGSNNETGVVEALRYAGLA